MVTHVVIFTWIAGVADVEIDALGRELDALSSDMRDAVHISHGPDLRFREGNGDYALIATFADQAGWLAYQQDPRHEAFVREFVMPIQASRVAIQF